MGVVIRRFEVYLIDLEPTRGAEISKQRPGVILSPDEMNRFLATVLIAPMTTTLRGYPSRVPSRFRGKSAEIALDQMRAVDKARLMRKLGLIGQATQAQLLSVLAEMFAP